MGSFAFEIVGRSPALMHHDDVMASDELDSWRKASENKNLRKAGDDRSPPWTWMSYLYWSQDREYLVVPSANIMACLRKAGSSIKLGGKKTAKAISQSCILMDDDAEFLVRGKRIPFGPVAALASLSFKEQFEGVQKLGFKLLVKRAAVESKKHVRVRAMFESWSARGTFEATDPVLTIDVLQDLFNEAGRYVGLFDWRPGSPKSPGPYGIFKATVKPL